jgi:hypothetical protein
MSRHSGIEVAVTWRRTMFRPKIFFIPRFTVWLDIENHIYTTAVGGASPNQTY